MKRRSLRGDRYAPRAKIEVARALRREATLAERVLWRAIRRQQLGVRFRRQHCIVGFIVDFYCAAVGLAIEIDGGVHDDVSTQESDVRRDAALAEYGVTTLRFRNEEVLGSLDDVCRRIREVVAALTGRAMNRALSEIVQ